MPTIRIPLKEIRQVGNPGVGGPVDTSSGNAEILRGVSSSLAELQSVIAKKKEQDQREQQLSDLTRFQLIQNRQAAADNAIDEAFDEESLATAQSEIDAIDKETTGFATGLTGERAERAKLLVAQRAEQSIRIHGKLLGRRQAIGNQRSRAIAQDSFRAARTLEEVDGARATAERFVSTMAATDVEKAEIVRELDEHALGEVIAHEMRTPAGAAKVKAQMGALDKRLSRQTISAIADVEEAEKREQGIIPFAAGNAELDANRDAAIDAASKFDPTTDDPDELVANFEKRHDEITARRLEEIEDPGQRTRFQAAATADKVRLDGGMRITLGQRGMQSAGSALDRNLESYRVSSLTEKTLSENLKRAEVSISLDLSLSQEQKTQRLDEFRKAAAINVANNQLLRDPINFDPDKFNASIGGILDANQVGAMHAERNQVIAKAIKDRAAADAKIIEKQQLEIRDFTKAEAITRNSKVSQAEEAEHGSYDGAVLFKLQESNRIAAKAKSLRESDDITETEYRETLDGVNKVQLSLAVDHSDRERADAVLSGGANYGGSAASDDQSAIDRAIRSSQTYQDALVGFQALPQEIRSKALQSYIVETIGKTNSTPPAIAHLTKALWSGSLQQRRLIAETMVFAYDENSSGIEVPNFQRQVGDATRADLQLSTADIVKMREFYENTIIYGTSEEGLKEAWEKTKDKARVETDELEKRVEGYWNRHLGDIATVLGGAVGAKNQSRRTQEIINVNPAAIRVYRDFLADYLEHNGSETNAGAHANSQMKKVYGASEFAAEGFMFNNPEERYGADGVQQIKLDLEAKKEQLREFGLTPQTARLTGFPGEDGEWKYKVNGTERADGTAMIVNLDRSKFPNDVSKSFGDKRLEGIQLYQLGKKGEANKAWGEAIAIGQRIKHLNDPVSKGVQKQVNGLRALQDDKTLKAAEKAYAEIPEMFLAPGVRRSLGQ